MGIHFYNAGSTVSGLSQKKRLREYLTNLFIIEGYKLASLDYIFCSDEFLLDINIQFLKHSDFTDVITFSYGSKKEPVEGEVYISIDRVKDNKNTLQTRYTIELHRVIFHGALHLCGYKDKTSTQKKHMREREDFYLTKYGLM